jgi:hypothetical protein
MRAPPQSVNQLHGFAQSSPTRTSGGSLERGIANSRARARSNHAQRAPLVGPETPCRGARAAGRRAAGSEVLSRVGPVAGAIPASVLIPDPGHHPAARRRDNDIRKHRDWPFAWRQVPPSDAAPCGQRSPLLPERRQHCRIGGRLGYLTLGSSWGRGLARRNP